MFRGDGADTGPAIYVSGGDAGSVSSVPFAGGGGEFGGGGASGSFEGPSGSVDQGSWDATIPAVASIGDTAGTSGGDVLQGLGDAVSGAGDSDSPFGVVAVIVVILAAALIGLIFGTVGYLIYHGSSLLCQVAFQSLLAANLRRRSKIMVHPDWSGSVIRMTWKPFGSIFIIVAILAGLIHHYFSDCTKLSEVINTLLFYLDW